MPILADGKTRTEKDSPDEEVEVVLEVDVVVAEVAGVEVSSLSLYLSRSQLISEPTRGGRGGRGGMRGGRGGYAGINGTPKQTTETTDTTTDGWAAAVEEATSGQNGEQGQEQAESSTQAAAAGKGDDFAAAGGWGDAPSATEISKAAKSGNSGWQGKGKQAVSQINTAAPAPTGPPKLTWAQIAK